MVVEYICLGDVQQAQGKSGGVVRYALCGVAVGILGQTAGDRTRALSHRDQRQQGRKELHIRRGERPLETKSQKERVK